MKHQIIIIALCLGTTVFGTMKVRAQNSAQVQTSVNIMLTDIIAVDMESATGGTVEYHYINLKDYNSSKPVSVPNSLMILSTKNLDVKVKTEGSYFTSGSNIIPVNILKVIATSDENLTSRNEVSLSETDQPLMNNVQFGYKQSFNINYFISEEKAKMVLLSKPSGRYMQTVVYTATAL